MCDYEPLQPLPNTWLEFYIWLDLGCQLLSPYLINRINMVEKVQMSFTRLISGVKGLSYPERSTALKLYSLQHRRERYINISVWKILEGLVPNVFPPICTKTSDCRGRTCIMSHIMLDDWEHRNITALAGVPSLCLTNYLCLYIISLYVLFIDSRNNWIATFLQCLILRVSQDSTTAWIMEIV